MAYIGKSPSTGIRNRFIYTATAGQTTFSGTDDHNRTLSYTDAEFTDVFLNGVKLDKSDYTATSGTSIVLDSGATVGDTLEILGFDTFSVFSGDFSQDVTVGGAATVSGDLTVDTNTLHVDSTNNRVGVGTSPAQPFHVKGGAVQFENTQNTYLQVNTTDTHLYTAAAHPLRFGTNSTERMRILAGGGLTFNGDTAAANALDDYEEGTFTATLTAATTAPSTPPTATGNYTKIGNLVNCRVVFSGVNTTGGAGYILVTGLPFSASSAGPYGDIMLHTLASFNSETANVATYISGTSVVPYQSLTTSGWASVTLNATSLGYLYFSATYPTSS